VPLGGERLIAVELTPGKLHLAIPEGTQAEVWIPVQKEHAGSPLRLRWAGIEVAAVASVFHGQAYARLLAEVGPGQHTFELVERDAGASLLAFAGGVFPPAAWPAALVQVDHATQGDWIGRYGSAGFHIFGVGATYPSQPYPGPPCNLAGSWTTETQHNVVITQAAGMAAP
jgi:hypothetical protein